MSETQVALALSSVPTMITVLIGILINNSRLTDLRATVEKRFDLLQGEMNRRFDDSRDVWRSELHRVEEVLDARLKHMEDR